MRHGVRVFVTAPVFSVIAVISIAFGSGANVAIFSAVDALLLRPPVAVSRPDDLLIVGSRVDRGIGTQLRTSYADYADIRDRSRSFDGLAAYGFKSVGFAAHPHTPARIKVAALVSANYFDVLGVSLQIGRAFLPDEDMVPGRDAVAILSDDAWQREFARDRNVLGRTIRIAATDFTIVGVAPSSFNGLDPFTPHDIFLPLAMWPRVMGTVPISPLDDRSLRVLTVEGRLRPNVTARAARAELATIGSELEQTFPATNRHHAITTQTQTQMRLERRPVDTRTLVLLSVLSVAVLLVACANVAGLLASRAPVRAREIALRLAIGASRTRIVMQLLAESVTIAVAGSACGLAVGYAGIEVFRQIEWPTEIIRYPTFEMDHRTLSFALAAALVSVFAFGLGPAIQTARLDLARAVKTTDMNPSKRRRLQGRHALVAAQVAVSLPVLTIGAFVFQIFQRELNAGPGFRVSHIAMARLDPSQARYTIDESRRLFERVLDEAKRLPGARSAAIASEAPLWGLEVTSMVPEGYHLDDGQTGVRLYNTSVDESFFDTLAIPILSGRAFKNTDTAEAPRVAIVNEAFARHYWPLQDVIGRRFRLGSAQGRWIQIVGVARTSTYIYTGEPAFEVAYFPFRQEPRGNMAVLVQTSGDSAGLLGPLREMVRRIDGDIPVFDTQTMEHFYEARATNINGLAVGLIGALGLMGLLLSVVGLYGLVSYDVGRRTREIGVRMAIGAGPRRVLAMIVNQGMAPAWVGLSIGLVLSAATARALPLLVPIGPRYDLRLMLATLPLILTVTLVAAGIPARRASRVDPTIALRAE
jgi:predicted permease